MKASIGYEIFPDRFCSTESKPGAVAWEIPVEKKEDASHQFVFYGGDLKGITSKLDYLSDIGIDFVYLTPIFRANTAHRYDCIDYFEIDAMLGKKEDLADLAEALHARNMRLVLDVAFNHVGLGHQWVTDSAFSDHLYQSGGKPTFWSNSPTLPEVNLENESVRQVLWRGKESVIAHWTEMGVDDWRLDCAYDIGIPYLTDITAVLHKMGEHKTIGEIWSYPGEWLKEGVLDGVMNYYFKTLTEMLLRNEIEGSAFGELVERTVADCGLDSILTCWNVLSTHDTPRLKTSMSQKWQLALALQFTLPGSPLIYYGEELGLESGGDPYNRQPMPWQTITPDNETMKHYKKWTELFHSSKSLSEGTFKNLKTNNNSITAFSRKGPSVAEYTIVILNPTDGEIDFTVFTEESLLMNATKMRDAFTGNTHPVWNSTVSGSVAAESFLVIKPDIRFSKYNPYKRVL